MITARDGWLSGLLDEYYAALGAGDPAGLPLAADARFTENGQRLAIGTGLWATATGVADSRAVTVSEEAYGPGGTAGQVAGWGMAAEGGEDALLGVRLKTTGRVISEIETLVVRRAPFGRRDYHGRDGDRGQPRQPHAGQELPAGQPQVAEHDQVRQVRARQRQ